MAYMDQATKSKINAVMKPILKKYNLKGSLSVNNHTVLVLTIRSGSIDFIKNFNEETSGKAVDYINVNPYHFDKHFSGKALKAMTEIYNAMMNGNHNNSDIMTDYFDVGWYIDINIGRWNKPYTME